MIKVKRKWSDAMAHSAHLLSECVENWSMPGHLWKYNQLWTMSIKIRKPSLALNLSKRMLKELSQLQKLIILPREEEGILTQTEFMFSKFCAEEKLKKKTSDHLLSMIKRRDFVIEDIRAETIRELETLISEIQTAAEIKYQNTIYGRRPMVNKKLRCIWGPWSW